MTFLGSSRLAHHPARRINFIAGPTPSPSIRLRSCHAQAVQVTHDRHQTGTSGRGGRIGLLASRQINRHRERARTVPRRGRPTGPAVRTPAEEAIDVGVAVPFSAVAVGAVARCAVAGGAADFPRSRVPGRWQLAGRLLVALLFLRLAVSDQAVPQASPGRHRARTFRSVRGEQVARSPASDGSRPPIAQGVGYRPEPALADNLEHERARQQRPRQQRKTRHRSTGRPRSRITSTGSPCLL